MIDIKEGDVILRPWASGYDSTNGSIYSDAVLHIVEVITSKKAGLLYVVKTLKTDVNRDGCNDDGSIDVRGANYWKPLIERDFLGGKERITEYPSRKMGRLEALIRYGVVYDSI